MERNAIVLTEETSARIAAYIAAVRWIFAKNYAETAPHEYTVRQWAIDLQGEFEFLVKVIRHHGWQARFGGQTYTYLDFNNYKYWTMGAPINETTVINREPIEGYNR